MRDPADLMQRLRSRVHVLDGGLATELEKRGHDISGKLWSARVLLEDPAAIEQLHYDYLKAGADIIITSSYQLTLEGAKAAGYSEAQAEDALLTSVELAVKARDRYLSELPDELPADRQPLIAASVGPWGAHLADGSEYKGDYGLQVAELMAFHWSKLDLLTQTDADLIAFETIPDGVEVVAITNLMLERELTCWVSCSLRDSRQLHGLGDIATVAAQLSGSPGLVAVGVNCTAPRHISGAVRAIRGVCDVPIVVYPNSGEGWDAVRRCWTGENDAAHFAGHARDWLKAGASIIGGCCRTGPEHIAQLRALVDNLPPGMPSSGRLPTVGR